MRLKQTDKEDRDLVQYLENEINRLNGEMQPIVDRLRTIEIRYRVEVDEIVYESGQKKRAL